MRQEVDKEGEKVRVEATLNITAGEVYNEIGGVRVGIFVEGHKDRETDSGFS